jgi:hypothetical protein
LAAFYFYNQSRSGGFNLGLETPVKVDAGGSSQISIPQVAAIGRLREAGRESHGYENLEEAKAACEKSAKKGDEILSREAKIHRHPLSHNPTF